MNEWKFFCANGGNQSWQVWVSLRGKTKMAESKMVEFKMAAIIKWSQIVNDVWVSLILVWVRVRVEWECFWVNLREENKVSESNMAEFKMATIINLSQYEWVKFLIQHGRILDGCHHQVESEWMSKVYFVQMVGREVWVKSFLCKWWEPILASVREFEREN